MRSPGLQALQAQRATPSRRLSALAAPLAVMYAFALLSLHDSSNPSAQGRSDSVILKWLD